MKAEIEKTTLEDINTITDGMIDRWTWFALCDRPKRDGARMHIHFEAMEDLNIDRYDFSNEALEIHNALYTRIENYLSKMVEVGELIITPEHQLVLVNDPNEKHWKEKKQPNNALARALYAIGYWIIGDD